MAGRLEEAGPAGVTGANVVHLFGGPYVTLGDDRLAVPDGSKRLLAFVALSRGPVERLYAAGALWQFVDDERAAGNLRSALWRLRRAGIDIIDANKWSLALAKDVSVDVQLVGEWATRLINGVPDTADLTLAALPPDALHLLPGWHDDFAIIERERIRQRTLHAMEALARCLTAEDRYAEAVAVARATMDVEPLRESAQRVLIEAHLSRGNWVEADQAFADFRRLLEAKLGVTPSEELVALMAAVDRGPFVPRRSQGRINPVAVSQ